jgi:hypothetical protein
MGDFFEPDEIIPMRISTVKRKIGKGVQHRFRMGSLPLSSTIPSPIRKIDLDRKTRYKSRHIKGTTSKQPSPGYESPILVVNAQKEGMK